MSAVAVFQGVSEDGLTYTAVRGKGVADALRAWGDNFVASYGDEVIFREEWPHAPYRGEDWAVIEWDEPPRTLLVVEREEDANEEMMAFLALAGDFEPIKVVAPPDGKWSLRWWEEEQGKLDDAAAKGVNVVFATCKAIEALMYLRYREGFKEANGEDHGGVYFLAHDPRHGYYLA